MGNSSADQTKEQIANHLQFLGYEIKRDENFLIARHSSRANIMLRAFSEGVLHTSLWRGSDQAKRNRQAFLEYLNGLNQQAGVVRYYADKDSDLFIEGWYTGSYDRTNYGLFLELWDKDLEKFARAPDSGTYLK